MEGDNIMDDDDQELFERRTTRLRNFMREVRRYLYGECIMANIPVATVECFCHDMFVAMARELDSCEFDTVLGLLLNEQFLPDVFVKFKAALH